MIWLYVAAICCIPIMIIVEVLNGRNFRCGCGNVITLPRAQKCYCQHLLGPWSITHIGHGIFFYGVLRSPLEDFPAAGVLAIVIIIESIWEMFENTEIVIDWYRRSGHTRYNGDSVVNSLGDITCCVIGAFVTMLFIG